jgi:hypothetical protein
MTLPTHIPAPVRGETTWWSHLSPEGRAAAADGPLDTQESTQ